jgi:hypothetical protein
MTLTALSFSQLLYPVSQLIATVVREISFFLGVLDLVPLLQPHQLLHPEAFFAWLIQ